MLRLVVGLVALIANISHVAAASVAPAPPSRFVIHFGSAYCDGETMSANVGGGDDGAFIIVGQPLSQSNGTPAAFNGSTSSTNTTLLFDDLRGDGRTLGAFLTPSNKRGELNLIRFAPNFSQFGWGFSGNNLTHQKVLPKDQFFSCLLSVNGGITTVLQYGAPFANGKLPAFCQKTTPIIVPI